MMTSKKKLECKLFEAQGKFLDLLYYLTISLTGVVLIWKCDKNLVPSPLIAKKKKKNVQHWK